MSKTVTLAANRYAEDEKLHKDERAIDLQKKGEYPIIPKVNPVDVFNWDDPLLPRQWHLFNKKQAGNDVNVTPVWQQGITGKGVVVCIIDDGVDHKHADLRRAFREDLSFDFNENVNVPVPNSKLGDHHGTRCAGLIAAEPNNHICGVGVAFDAQISAIRILSKSLSAQDEAAAVVHRYNDNHVFSCSWGPADNGAALDGPSRPVLKAFVDGICNGRSGRGSLYVFATGNGRCDDNCNFDGYANGVFSLTIGAIDCYNAMPVYMEPCSAQLAVTYSSGYDRKIATCDLGNDSCTFKHGGTSAAAPLAAGIFALLLQARPDLTWRDVQHICVRAAVKISHLDQSWKVNGAGFSYSQKFGFGKLDANEMVSLAKKWGLVPPPIIKSMPCRLIYKKIPSGSSSGISDIALVSEESCRTLHIGADFVLEHVTVTVDLRHPRRGDLQIILRSPSGMSSQLASKRPMDTSKEGLRGWTFMTVAFWGESVQGPWAINVIDSIGDSKESEGILVQWRITFWGSSMSQKINSSEYAEDFLNNYFPPHVDYFSDTLGIWTDLGKRPLPIAHRPLLHLALSSFLMAMLFFVLFRKLVCRLPVYNLIRRPNSAVIDT